MAVVVVVVVVEHLDWGDCMLRASHHPQSRNMLGNAQK
jgi:hypothetical protein